MKSSQMNPSTHSLRRRIFAKERIHETILLSMVTSYTVIFSYLTVLKLQALGMHAWDFGIYLQAIHTTATSGRLFYATPELPYTLTAIPPGTEFAVHFSPILFLVVPFYALFQTPITILVIKSFIIALGAIPVFLLAKRELGQSTWGLVFAGGYLLYPAVQAISWYDFEPHVFFPVLVLFTVLFIESGRNKLALLFGVLSMFSIEIAPFFIIALGIGYLMLQRKSLIELFKKRRFFGVFKSIPTALILTAIVWLAFVFSTGILLGWQTSFHLSNERRIATANSLNLLGALSFDGQMKLLYLGLILGPFAFLSLLSPIRLFPGGLWIIYAMLSNYSPYYSISFQYPSFVIPFVAVSAIFGFKKLLKPSIKKRRRITSLILCIVISLATVISSPIGPLHVGNHPWAEPFGVPTMTPHDQVLHDLIGLIPTNASILTSNDLFPQVAQRINAYAFPFGATFQHPEDFNSTLDTYLQESEYVLYDAQVDQTATVTLPTRDALKAFGLYAEADGAILLRKGYVGTPMLFLPYEETFRSNDLVPINGTIIQDPSSESGKVLCHYPSSSTSDFWYGPGCFLARGGYSVDFRLKLVDRQANSSLPVISIAIVEWPASAIINMSGSESMWFIPTIVWQYVPQKVVLTTSLQTNVFVQTGSYQTFSLQFTVEQPGGFEFVGLAVLNATKVCLDYIKLTQVTS